MVTRETKAPSASLVALIVAACAGGGVSSAGSAVPPPPNSLGRAAVGRHAGALPAGLVVPATQLASRNESRRAAEMGNPLLLQQCRIGDAGESFRGAQLAVASARADVLVAQEALLRAIFRLRQDAYGWPSPASATGRCRLTPARSAASTVSGTSPRDVRLIAILCPDR